MGARSNPVEDSQSLANARVGRVIAEKYRLTRLVGAGSIGAVYEAVHLFTQKHVALKVIDARVSEHEGFAVRFLQEAQAAAAIGHPVICDVFDAGREPDGTLYLALELLEGRTLEAAIETNDLRLDELIEVSVQLLDGLAAAHDRGIVHRDVKPENVFLTWDAQGELRVKLLDFGVAKNTKGGPAPASTQQGQILGTPYFMAPEQAAGDAVDTRADLWGAGATLFFALSGRPPFDAENYNKLIAKLLHERPPRLAEVRSDLPEFLGMAVDRALQRDPAHRWQSARTMAETLRQRGRGEIELDWELHEDATVRTESPFAEEDDAPRLLKALNSERSVEIDLAAFELAFKPPPPAPVRRGPGPWPFVIFGVAVVIAVILALALALR